MKLIVSCVGVVFEPQCNSRGCVVRPGDSVSVIVPPSDQSASLHIASLSYRYLSGNAHVRSKIFCFPFGDK